MSKVVLDSCIFVEAWTEGEFVEMCSKLIRKYMNDPRASCYIPIIVPGEVIKRILEIRGKERTINILREYTHSFLNHNIRFMDIDKDVLKIKNELGGIRIQEHDKLIIACSIKFGCTEIITLDDAMYEEREQIAKISKDICGHRIRIINPRLKLKRRKKK